MGGIAKQCNSKTAQEGCVWGHKRNRGHTEVKGFLERGYLSATVEKWVMVLLHIKKVPGTKPVCVQFAYMSTPFPCTILRHTLVN